MSVSTKLRIAFNEGMRRQLERYHRVVDLEGVPATVFTELGGGVAKDLAPHFRRAELCLNVGGLEYKVSFQLSSPRSHISIKTPGAEKNNYAGIIDMARSIGYLTNGAVEGGPAEFPPGLLALVYPSRMDSLRGVQRVMMDIMERYKMESPTANASFVEVPHGLYDFLRTVPGLSGLKATD